MSIPGGCALALGCERLEARVLLALAAVAGNRGEFTDADGDRVVVQLTGPGSLYVDGAGPAAGIGIDQSTSVSRLSISVRKAGAGDGRLVMQGSLQSGPLKSLSAPAVDFQGLGVALSGACSEIKIGDLLLGADCVINLAALGDLKFQARRVDGGILGQSILNFGGMNVTSFRAADLVRGGLSAATIRSLTVAPSAGSEGSVRLFALSIVGSDEVIEDLGTVSIFGPVVDSNWSVDGGVGSVTLGSGQQLTFEGSGLLRSLRVKGDLGTATSFGRIGQLVVDGELSGNVDARDVDALGVSIGTIRAATTAILRITTALAPARGDTTFFPRIGAITQIRLAEGGSGLDRVNISAGRIDTFTVTGKSSAGLPGDLRVNLLLSTTQQTIGRLSVKGVLSGDLLSLGSVNEIKATGLVDLKMAVGANVSTLTELNDLFDNGLFLEDLRGGSIPPASTINRLIVSKPPTARGFSAANPNLENIAVYAGRINTLDVFTGFADDTSGYPVGIETTQVGALKIRRDGSTLSRSGVTASVLQGLGGVPTLLPVVVGTFAVDASLGPTTAVHDMLLRVFFL